MGKTLTMVGQARSKNPADDDLAISSIAALIVQAAGPNHEWARVSSVNHVWKTLRNLTDKSAYDLIQLVGHGTRGMLFLSGTTEYQTGHNAYVLDSNPLIYGLLSELVDPRTKVWLLGCLVGDGAAAAQYATVADGPTLLFDLARMWGCEVSAPTLLVSDEHFGPDGVFKETNHLTTVGPSGIIKMGAPDPLKLGWTSSQSLPVVKAIQAPVLGALTSQAAARLKLADLKTTASITVSPFESRPLLAATELELQLTFEGEEVTAQVLAGFSVLRFQTRAGALRYFRIHPESQTALVRSVRSLALQALR